MVIMILVGAEDIFEGRKASVSHGRMDFRHFAVRAEMYDAVEPGESKIDHQAHACGQLIIVGGDGAPFEGVEELGGVETEDLAAAKISDHFPGVAAAKGVGSIEIQLQAVAIRYFLQLFRVAGATPCVNAEDGGSPRGDESLSFFRIHQVRAGIDVHEHRLQSLPVHRVRCGDKGESRHQDLALEIECMTGDLQADGRIAYWNTMANTEEIAELSFQFPDDLAVISEPAPLENTFEVLHEHGVIAEIGSAYEEHRIIKFNIYLDFAGIPTTVMSSGTLFVTIAPAPILQWFPTLISGRITAFVPIDV